MIGVFKSNLLLYSLIYAKACNKFVGSISASLPLGSTASFEETSQRWRVVGNTVSNLTGPRFEPETSLSKDEHVTFRPTGRSNFSLLVHLPRAFYEFSKVLLTKFAGTFLLAASYERFKCINYFCLKND